MSALLKPHTHFTYADYITWDDSVRCELIDGVVYMMASPTQAHQEMIGEVFGQLRDFLRGKPCKVFLSPFDVRLNPFEKDDIVCQPDLLVVCDLAKLDGKNCTGAPDFILEVISPSTAGKDRVLKFNRYLQAGVREYWIIDPEEQSLSTFILVNGQYIAQAYSEEDEVPVHVLDGCVIRLADVFALV